MKRCTKCLIESNNFSPDKRRIDGLQSSCRECNRKTIKKFREDNPGYNKNSCAKYYIEHKETLLINKREDYIINRDEILLKKKEYGKTERGREVQRLNSSKRRALKVSTSDGSIDINKTQQLLDEQGGVCNYCGLDITDRSTRHLDHIHPLSKGGTHTIDNVQWLCSTCNLLKGNKINYGY